MLRASVTIFVCLLSHVRSICDYLLPPVRKSATRSHVKYRQIEKLIDEKHNYRPFLTYLALQGENRSFLT